MKHSADIDRLRIATPCPISWEQMTGDDRVRFCDHCSLHVYNISALSRIEAETLIASTEGRLCARLYQRADGSVLTKDCPVGLRALRMRISKRAAAVFAAVMSISSAAFGQQASANQDKTGCTPQTKITRTTAPPDHADTSLSGTVRDVNGEEVAGVRLSIVNTDTQEIDNTSTTDKGTFRFDSLAVGNYSLKIEALGFKDHTITNIVIEKNQLTSLDTILEPANTITVTVGIVDLPVSAIDPSSSTIKFSMSGDTIRKLPLPK